MSLVENSSSTEARHQRSWDTQRHLPLWRLWLSNFWPKLWRTYSPLSCRHWQGIKKNPAAAPKYCQSHSSHRSCNWCCYIWRNSCPSRNSGYKTKCKSWGLQCPFCATWDGAPKEFRFFRDCWHWSGQVEPPKTRFRLKNWWWKADSVFPSAEEGYDRIL